MGLPAALFVIPIVLYFVTRRICAELERAERIEHDSEQAEAEARAGAAPRRRASALRTARIMAKPLPGFTLSLRA